MERSCARTLSGFDVTGIDFSEAMLKLAKINVPNAKFIKKDMIEMDFKDNSFDGLIACYSIIHVPQEKHSLLFQNIHQILKPNGVMLVSLGSTEWEGIDDFYGVNMFWSYNSPQKSLQMIKDVGFEIMFDMFIIGNTLDLRIIDDEMERVSIDEPWFKD